MCFMLKHTFNSGKKVAACGCFSNWSSFSKAGSSIEIMNLYGVMTQQSLFGSSVGPGACSRVA